MATARDNNVPGRCVLAFTGTIFINCMRGKINKTPGTIPPAAPADVAQITETLLKVATGNDHHLSDMADNKAQILITVNSIILSAVISLSLGHVKEFHALVIPVLILLGTSLVTLIFAILSTRPSVPRGHFTMNDLEQRKVNLLFFGNFYRMPMSDYSAGMGHLLSDPDFIYESLIMDVYNQGVILGRKYRLLRVAYNIFMTGFIVAIIAFLVVMRKSLLAA